MIEAYDNEAQSDEPCHNRAGNVLRSASTVARRRLFYADATRCGLRQRSSSVPFVIGSACAQVPARESQPDFHQKRCLISQPQIPQRVDANLRGTSRERSPNDITINNRFQLVLPLDGTRALRTIILGPILLTPRASEHITSMFEHSQGLTFQKSAPARNKGQHDSGRLISRTGLTYGDRQASHRQGAIKESPPAETKEPRAVGGWKAYRFVGAIISDVSAFGDPT